MTERSAANCKESILNALLYGALEINWREKMNIKQEIINTIDDLASNFLYYDRKEDEDLPKGAIEEAIKSGEITYGEIVERFKEQLLKGIAI